MSASRIVLLTAGVLLAFVALAVLAGGGALVWADSQRDDDGFYTTSEEPFETSTFALVSEDLDIASDAPGWLFGSGRFGDIRLTGSSVGPSREIFIGIGDESDVEAYLDGVQHDVVTNIDFDPFEATYRREAGGAAPEPPGDAGFWAASAEGAGTQTLEWEVESGNWTVVVMNGDAARDVRVDMAFGANIGFLLGLGIGVLVVGALLMVGAGVMIFFGARSPRRAPAPTPDGSPPPAGEDRQP